MNTGFHFRCGISAGASPSDRGVSQSSRVRLWPGPSRFSLSEHQQPSKQNQLGSGRSGIAVGRRRDLRAVWPAVSGPLRYDPSSPEHGRRDGRGLRVLAPQGGPSRLPSRAHSLRRSARSRQTEMVAWHLAVRPQPEYRQVAMHANSCRKEQRICAQRRVFSQLRRCHGRRRIPNQLLALLTAPGGMRQLKERSYSMRRTTRCRPGRNAAIAESHIQRMREAQ